MRRGRALLLVRGASARCVVEFGRLPGVSPAVFLLFLQCVLVRSLFKCMQPLSVAACCGFDLCHKYFLYIVLYVLYIHSHSLRLRAHAG